MTKLIKLSETHYVIVDDSEIKKGDVLLSKDNIIHTNYGWNFGDRVITHSTQPLGTSITISLSEVEELLYGYNVEDLAHNVMMNYLTNGNPYGDFKKSTIGADDNKNWWIQGFNAHKKLVENKLMIDIEKFKDISHSFFSLYRTNEFSDDELELEFENILNNIIQKFSSKNVWDVGFNEEKKLILIK